jgi:hypothetical protein
MSISEKDFDVSDPLSSRVISWSHHYARGRMFSHPAPSAEIKEENKWVYGK